MTGQAEKITYQIEIRAPREKIWESLISDASYRDWCAAFFPGSYFEGDWSEGSLMRFLGADEEGRVMGMLARVLEHQPGQRCTLQHFAMIENGEPKEGIGEESWGDAIEQYELQGGPETYTLTVTQDTAESMASYFRETWPKALARLKEISES